MDLAAVELLVLLGAAACGRQKATGGGLSRERDVTAVRRFAFFACSDGRAWRDGERKAC